jgi:hypothetical protein
MDCRLKTEDWLIIGEDSVWSEKKAIKLTDQWTQYEIKMSEFGKVPDRINVLQWQAGRDGGSLLLDDIKLLPSASKWYSPASTADGVKLYYDAKGARSSKLSDDAVPATTTAATTTTTTPKAVTSSAARLTSLTSMITSAPTALCGNGKMDDGEECEIDDGGCCDKKTCKFVCKSR